MPKPSYPFIPKSTAYLVPGQFWEIPLANGRFACGRVIELEIVDGRPHTRMFLAGLMDWSGDEPPGAYALAGCQVLEQGNAHIKTIVANGGRILGHRPLESEGIEPWLFLSQSPGPGCYLQRGYETLRLATSEEQRQYKTFSTWGFGVIVVAAEEHFGS